MVDAVDVGARNLTMGLIEFLVDVTESAERRQVHDICPDDGNAGWEVLWWDELPEALAGSGDEADGALLRAAPPILEPEPQLPEVLRGWVHENAERTFDGPEPSLHAVGPILPSELGSIEPSPPPASVSRSFDRWRAVWLGWAERRRQAEEHRAFYERLEEITKTVDQRDDEYELVLGLGLVRWIGSDGREIRRHLITEQVLPVLRRDTADIVVSRIGASLRAEDRQLFGGINEYFPDRAGGARESLLGDRWLGADPRGAHQFLDKIAEWLAACVGTEVRRAPAGAHRQKLGRQLELSLAPALLLRPRSKVLLAEAYKRIARELSDPDAPVPVGLTQLVQDTEPAQRQLWITEQGGVTGDFLGDDPRFPLEANAEQERVMALLRSETGVVVQGPPGTGKTHTIANLVAALLARGQRVLVTSQKDQALRVLREKIPEPLRPLCVLLAGGSKDAATELREGLDALSDAIATSDNDALRRQAESLGQERVALRRRSAVLNAEIGQLRAVENDEHGPRVPQFDPTMYRGTMAAIVRDVKRGEPRYGWFPSLGTASPDQPPFPERDAVELRGLLLSDTPARRARTTQWIPGAADLTTAAEFARMVTAEEEANRAAAADGPLPQRLAQLGEGSLGELDELRVDAVRLLGEIGCATGTGAAQAAPSWVTRAVNDHLAGKGSQLWAALGELKDEPGRLQRQLDAQGVNYVVEVEPITRESLGAARGALDTGRALAAYLRDGGRLKRRFPSSAQRGAENFLEMVRVNGGRPGDLAHVLAGIEQLEAEVAVVQLAAAWADRGVEVLTGRLPVVLSDLAEKAQVLDKIQQIAGLRARIALILRPTGLSTEFPDAEALMEVLDAVTAARRRLLREQVLAEIDQLRQWFQAAEASPRGCPELTGLARAVLARDAAGYRAGLEELNRAESERSDAMRLEVLTEQMRAAHPGLLALLERTAAEPQWEQRLPELSAAWAWSTARDFVQGSRTAAREQELIEEFTRVEEQLKLVTQRLAGVEALVACLDRMTDAHARALRTYRDHMMKVGAGTGKRVRQFQSAARAAMEKAKGAVPAWVVPLPNLLDNLAVERDSFDVVIVDEASQVGMEHLFLLWMAPRVIVVGDDKQCTPGEARMGQHDRIFASLPRYLAAADEEVRAMFNPKSNLYGLLSARSGKDAVIRLREHFRCVPEIIGWSSKQFYGSGGVPGLIALRERTAADLDPLKVVTVTGGFTEGRNTLLRNPVEAKMIADELTRCVHDPRYTGKTFGVVVLQGRGQVRLLELELNARLTPEERVERKVRVGVPADFQGDERDVVFLSMVVANGPRAQRSTMAQQSYNVAASRAKDQMWLFSSVPPGELKTDDLRFSLLDYMRHPPSTYGSSPELDEVSETERCTPFDSLFEQRVFREIRRRGYHVVPQYPVGSRRLDLVVVGDGGRLAVECDGHRWHTSAEQVVSDARRDRELQRMRWQLVRVRESEFEFDRDRALAPLWLALSVRGIEPVEHPGGSESGSGAAQWEPVEFAESDDEDEAALLAEADGAGTGNADHVRVTRGGL